jgi:hypothetical protein
MSEERITACTGITQSNRVLLRLAGRGMVPVRQVAWKSSRQGCENARAFLLQSSLSHDTPLSRSPGLDPLKFNCGFYF